MKDIFGKIQYSIVNNKAFTLMELTAVVLILGILAAIGLPQYERAMEKSRAAEAFTMLGNIVTAEEMYVLQTGEFTDDFSNLMLQMPLQPKNKDASGSYSSGTGKAFDYDLSDCQYNTCTISAHRLQGANYAYEIRLSDMDMTGNKGVRTCHSSDEKGIQICLLLCGVDEMPAGGSCSID